MPKLVLTLYVLLIGPILHAAEINWRTDYAQARQEARDLYRPLAIYYTTDDCVECARLYPYLAELANVLNTDFIPVKADAWLSQRARVVSFPTLTLAAPSGQVLGKIVGNHPHQLQPALKKALASVPPGKAETTERLAHCGRPCPCKECWCEHTGQSCASGKPCLPMGMDPTKLSKEELCWFGDTPARPEELRGEGIPDLSGLGFITVFSKDKEKRDRIADALAATKLAEKYRICALDPDSPVAQGFKLAEDREFQRTGLKVIVQAPASGGFARELGKSYAWSGSESFEAEFGRLDPGYDPNARTSTLNLQPLVIAGIGLVGLALLPCGLILLPARQGEDDALAA